MAKCLKIPAPTGVFVFDLTEALQDGLGGFFVYCLSLFVFCVLSFVGRGCALFSLHLQLSVLMMASLLWLQ